LDLRSIVCTERERGLEGVAVDPDFSTNQYIYLYYTFKKHGGCDIQTAQTPVNRVSRFTLPPNNIIELASELVLVDNIPSYGGTHNAGDLKFGKDGYLYISVGDGGRDYANRSDSSELNQAARDQHVLLGKILRITTTGAIPPDNPFQGADSARCFQAGHTEPGTKCQETFAWGLRNPFRMAFDPNAADTRFVINDTGQNAWEEINVAQMGADYGWNVREGNCARGSQTDCGPPPDGMTDPLYTYNHSGGCIAITGGAFVPTGTWPAVYDGVYLFSDFACPTIFELVPSPKHGYTVRPFITAVGGIVSMTFGPDSTGKALYYTTYADGGQVRRITYTITTSDASLRSMLLALVLRSTPPPYWRNSSTAP
jgi:glucose/arabinose dehydrogenase